MSWAEIKKAVNSDITKPLNILASELSEEKIEIINSIISELDNPNHGLEAIKRTIGVSETGQSKKAFFTTGIKRTLLEEASIVSTLPYEFYTGAAVVLNNEIHILGGGGYTSEANTKHYKFDGTSWTEVSTLPYEFYASDAVVLNNEIHILGSGRNGDFYRHYKWDGTSWTSVSSLPYAYGGTVAVVYNNEIHILGSGSSSSGSKKHYKWDGTSWTSVSTIPYNFHAKAIIYNNEIHILGSGFSGSSKLHYKWDGTSWTSVSTLPYEVTSSSSVVVLKNEIYILGGSDTGVYKNYYKWDGAIWGKVSSLPYNFSGGEAILYNNEIQILGSNSDGVKTNHYSLIAKYLFQAYLPSGVIITFFEEVLKNTVNARLNCEKVSDNEFIVKSDGLVEIEYSGINMLKELEYVIS